MKPWYGVDLDGTLATYNGWQGAGNIGEPILLTIERLKKRLANGQDVRIFTARVFPGDPTKMYPDEFELRSKEAIVARREIQAWCLKHIGVVLPITYQKDFSMVDLEDDRCTQIEPNTGRLAVDVAFSRGYSQGLANGKTERDINGVMEYNRGFNDGKHNGYNDGYHDGYANCFEKEKLENEGGITT